MIIKSKIKDILCKSPISITGFTLVEIIVVMAIMSILASALFANFFNTMTKSRDSRRKQDIDSIAKALELYYSDNRSYPQVLPTGGGMLLNPNDPNIIYMQQIPKGPQEEDYCYDSSDGTYYKLYADMENANDPKLLNPTITCSGEDYNFGISSSNVRPN